MLHAVASEANMERTAARGRAPAAALAAPDVAFEPSVVGNQMLLRTFGAPARLRPSRMPLLQRQCVCGGACADCKDKAKLQTKLAVNEPGDDYEREADRVADQVMRMPDAAVQAQSESSADASTPHSHDEPVGGGLRIQSLQDREGVAGESVSDFVSQLGAGAPLDGVSRAFFEPRFGYRFGNVRIHTGPHADAAAAGVRARAFTIGRDVVFARDQFAPRSAGGATLLAHELTHVVQQAGAREPSRLQRQSAPTDVPASAVFRDAPNAKTWSGAPARCGPDFCRPLPSEGMAIDSRTNMWPIFMLGIAFAVSRRVLPLWSKWAFGGSGSVIDITQDFGADFFASQTTATTTAFLASEIKTKLAASPPVLTAGSAKVPIATLVPAAVAAIDDPASLNQMNFNVIGEIPGNIAGGIGKDQAANPVGAQPSSQNDARIVNGDVTVFDAGANLMVVPNLTYTVRDTVDLCPGDCGAAREQTATIPMSQWEATGISGDVPFKVDFPATMIPFIVPKPAAPGAPASAPALAPTPAPPKGP